MAEITSDVSKAVNLLKNGGLIGFPTETVYGLAANGLNPDAVVKIFQVKNRPSFDPLIIHTHSVTEVEKYVKNIPRKARRLAELFWPGPLTLVLEKNAIIPDLVTSGLDTVAMRIPYHPLALELLHQLHFPLAAPSANPFGYVSPTTPNHVNSQLSDKISLILDGGQCDIGLESTIIGFNGDKVIIYRLGGKIIEEIEDAVGKVKIMLNEGSNPKAPGMLDKHYAPGTPLVLGNLDQLVVDHGEKEIGILSLSKSYETIDQKNQIQLSSKGDLGEAAKNLFKSLRHFDSMKLDVILAEKMPDHGLGRAINDRLKRAAS
ncbi:MAG: L-threonylcarbamoyladenylate synthase [Bacteroidetes bacterium]|nr:L-threonylcarbamoyladenylate synthase [Bacteroidota bacterium]MDA1119332.1 L-threonylcarbamoyladenylate synthase [Bacteroidota bacterium]